jgi:hypothetical protein
MWAARVFYVMNGFDGHAPGIATKSYVASGKDEILSSGTAAHCKSYHTHTHTIWSKMSEKPASTHERYLQRLHVLLSLMVIPRQSSATVEQKQVYLSRVISCSTTVVFSLPSGSKLFSLSVPL